MFLHLGMSAQIQKTLIIFTKVHTKVGEICYNYVCKKEFYNEKNF